MAEFKLKQTAEEVQKAVDNSLSFGDFPTGGDTLVIPAYSEEELMAKLESGEIVFVAAAGLVKMSNAIVTMADLSNGCTYANGFYGAFDIPAEEITYQVDGVITLPEHWAFFVDESAVGVDNDGIVFPEPGVYFVAEFLLTNNGLAIPGYTGFPVTKKMDSKYYVGSTMFYTDETYLYTDALYTTKATKADITKAMGRGTIAVFIVGAAAWAPCNINLMSYDYAVVACMTWQGEDTLQTKFFYTAEYTP